MMRSAIVDDGIVVNVIVGAVDGSITCEPDVGVGWAYDGENFTPPPSVEPEPTLADYQAAIQGHVDDVARTRLYSGGNACASYAASTVPQWAAEAAAFVAWRDAVWVYAYAELGKVENGQRPQPTIPAFVDELPAINWPLAAMRKGAA